MLFRFVLTLAPEEGGWSTDRAERLVGTQMVEAESFKDALAQLNIDVKTQDLIELPRRTAT